MINIYNPKSKLNTMKNIKFITLLLVQFILITTLYFSFSYDLSLCEFFNFKNGYDKQMISVLVATGPVLASVGLRYYSKKNKK